MKYTDEEITQHRQQFLDGLRSGKYPQTTGQLKNKEGYCCLGVASEESGLGRWLKNGAYKTSRYAASEFGLVPEVQDWLGVGDTDPYIDGGNTRASYCNDGLNWTFEEIADSFAEKWGMK